MEHTEPFSMSTMFNALQHLCFYPVRETMQEELQAVPPPPPPSPRGISVAIPPPGFTPRRETNIPIENHPLINSCRCRFYPTLFPQELEMRLHSIFNLMTSREDEALFKDTISNLNRRELHRMASLLTSNSNYFMVIARNQCGSKRLQKLIGKSDDVDTFFSAAIVRRFLHVMTDKHASYVATRGIRVFDQEIKKSMYELTLHHALELAGDQHGCIALNEVITDADDPYYREQLLDIVAHNALCLSNDAYGNFVIQHVLKLYDLRCTRNIALNLRGHCVELSFRKHGSYIVERLLEAEDLVMRVVVRELLECQGERLMRLARSEYGNFVVNKALRLTREVMTRANLFWGLVRKLMPFRHLLFRSRGSNIAAILNSIH